MKTRMERYVAQRSRPLESSFMDIAGELPKPPRLPVDSNVMIGAVSM
jgi:hypothetical protein